MAAWLSPSKVQSLVVQFCRRSSVDDALSPRGANRNRDAGALAPTPPLPKRLVPPPPLPLPPRRQQGCEHVGGGAVQGQGDSVEHGDPSPRTRRALHMDCAAASAGLSAEDSHGGVSRSASCTPHTLRKGRSEGLQATPDTEAELVCASEGRAVRKRKSTAHVATSATGSCDAKGRKQRKMEIIGRSAPSCTVDKARERGSWIERRVRKEFFDPENGSSFGFYKGTVKLWAGKTDTYQILYDDGQDEVITYEEMKRHALESERFNRMKTSGASSAGSSTLRCKKQAKKLQNAAGLAPSDADCSPIGSSTPFGKIPGLASSVLRSPPRAGTSARICLRQSPRCGGSLAPQGAGIVPDVKSPSLWTESKSPSGKNVFQECGLQRREKSPIASKRSAPRTRTPTLSPRGSPPSKKANAAIRARSITPILPRIADVGSMLSANSNSAIDRRHDGAEQTLRPAATQRTATETAAEASAAKPLLGPLAAPVRVCVALSAAVQVATPADPAATPANPLPCDEPAPSPSLPPEAAAAAQEVESCTEAHTTGPRARKSVQGQERGVRVGVGLSIARKGKAGGKGLRGTSLSRMRSRIRDASRGKGPYKEAQSRREKGASAAQALRRKTPGSHVAGTQTATEMSTSKEGKCEAIDGQPRPIPASLMTYDNDRRFLEYVHQQLDVIRVVGSGTYGEVYECWDRVNKREVAMKRFIPGVNNAQGCRSCLTEKQFIQRLSGRMNVVNVLPSPPLAPDGHIMLEDQSALVLTFLRHDTPKSIVREFSREEMRDYMFELLSALTEVHAAGIAHNDIKLSNILFDRAQRKCLLVDFGLACDAKPARRDREQQQGAGQAAREQGKASGGGRSALLQKGRNPLAHHSSLVGIKGKVAGGAAAAKSAKAHKHKALRNGTKGFRAPEVVLGSHHQTCAVDIWSAGVVLLCLVTRAQHFSWLTHESDSKVIFVDPTLIRPQRLKPCLIWRS